MAVQLPQADNAQPPPGAPGASVFDLDHDALAAVCEELVLPSYTADQVLDWVYRKRVTSFEAMTNLSRRARDRLRARVGCFTGSIAAQQHATDGTEKLLITWAPGARQTECVMIPTESRRTACVSSQVGCPVGCRFCASGLEGSEGNLTAGRIVEQAYRLSLLPGIERITNVVFMGMGEPLANLDAVTTAMRILNAPWGMGISARRITVSTVGLPGAIRKLAAFELPVTLALSLHAPNDALRRELIPWAEYAPIDELLEACDEYFRHTGREITLEYLLLRRVNDRRAHAEELASVARRLRANVNLIRYNEVAGLPFERPTTEDVRAFQEVLRQRRINVHLRASRGRDIAAACGQLRHERRLK